MIVALGRRTWRDRKGVVTKDEWLWYDPLVDRLARSATEDGPRTIVQPSEGGYHHEYVRGRMEAGMVKFIEASVEIDVGEPSYPCFLWDGDTWNGWEKPYFTLETALQIAKDRRYPECDKMYDRDTSTLESALNIMQDHKYTTWEMKYDKKMDTFTVLDENDEPGEHETFTGVDIQGHHLYPIGAGSWIWSRAEGDKKEAKNGEDKVGPGQGR